MTDIHSSAMMLMRNIGYLMVADPDSKVHGAHMGPIRGRQDPGGPHVGPMSFAIWVIAFVYFSAVFLMMNSILLWFYFAKSWW